MTNKKCCEKCIEWDDAGHQQRCINKNCKCHEEIADWEERFDEYFYDSEHSLTKNQIEHIKKALFIPLLSRQKEKQREEYEKTINSAIRITRKNRDNEMIDFAKKEEKNKQAFIKQEDESIGDFLERANYCKGYNQALSDIINHLKNNE